MSSRRRNAKPKATSANKNNSNQSRPAAAEKPRDEKHDKDNNAAKNSASAKPTRSPSDNYWNYSVYLLCKTLRNYQPKDDDFMGKLLPMLHSMPKDKSRIRTRDEALLDYSDETIREFESRYTDIVPLGSHTKITLNKVMTRCMSLFVKLHLATIKGAKVTSISAFDAFMTRDVKYKCNEIGLLFYMDKEFIVGKINRVLSVDVLTFDNDVQDEDDGERRTFHFMLVQPLRQGQFDAEEVYPLGWYAPIIRPITFEKNEGQWYTYAYHIPSDFDSSSDSE